MTMTASVRDIPDTTPDGPIRKPDASATHTDQVTDPPTGELASPLTTTRKGRLTVAREAGFPRISLISVAAGTLVAYGAFALLSALGASVLDALNVKNDFRTNDWTSETAAGGIAFVAVLLLAWIFGGYVAGRMARRSGVLHGALVFVLGVVLAAGIGGAVSGLADNGDVEHNLRSIGVPTSVDQWGQVGVGIAIAGLASMLVGALLGGLLGERWHTRLARRAADPEIGATAVERRRVEAEQQAEHERFAREAAERRQEREAAERREREEALPPLVAQEADVASEDRTRGEVDVPADARPKTATGAVAARVQAEREAADRGAAERDDIEHDAVTREEPAGDAGPRQDIAPEPVTREEPEPDERDRPTTSPPWPSREPVTREEVVRADGTREPIVRSRPADR
jgi:hypothetical protein